MSCNSSHIITAHNCHIKLTRSLDPRFSHNHCQDTEKECKDNFKVHFALNFTQVNKQLDAKPSASFKIRMLFFIPNSVNSVMDFHLSWVKIS